MQDVSVEFASLLCSRLCHDLLSPVGALNNGLELLQDEQDPEMRAQCMELLADSARASADKLKFFRLAFGAAGGYGDDIDAREAKAALEGIVRGNKRVHFGWLVDQSNLSRGATRILLNLALIALDALVRGGRLDVGVEADEVVIRAEGPRLVIDAEIRALLEGEDVGDAMSSRTAGALLIRELARREGRSLRFSEEDGILLFGVTAPAVMAPA
ncbi:histidine phosphotransferase family protein [Sphingomonas sp. BIUV-7]|uniref:Histidine phosphotransferase family protein n=1 Tax=Sphingomonas natans TaxID=3063330 RepID=A0ABT8Y4K8_9SPHN|nr:histidine phosphotransferase family protein [Sphingomonas sp. BIUV-7]MDO6413255.1 histidine phosphotransferase family protein [Sphingomonas sp. BIUV-7]